MHSNTRPLIAIITLFFTTFTLKTAREKKSDIDKISRALSFNEARSNRVAYVLKIMRPRYGALQKSREKEGKTDPSFDIITAVTIAEKMMSNNAQAPHFQNSFMKRIAKNRKKRTRLTKTLVSKLKKCSRFHPRLSSIPTHRNETVETKTHRSLSPQPTRPCPTSISILLRTSRERCHAKTPPPPPPQTVPVGTNHGDTDIARRG